MSEHGIDGVYIYVYGILQHGNTCNRLNNEHDNKLQCMELFFLSFQGMLGPGHGRFQQKNIEFYQWVVSKKVDTTRWKFRRKNIINLEILGHISFKHVPSLSVGEQIASPKGHD